MPQSDSSKAIHDPLNIQRKEEEEEMQVEVIDERLE